MLNQHNKLEELVDEKDVQLSFFDEDTGTEVVLPEEPGVSYILRKKTLPGKLRGEDKRCRWPPRQRLCLRKKPSRSAKAGDTNLAKKEAKVFVAVRQEGVLCLNIFRPRRDEGDRLIDARHTFSLMAVSLFSVTRLHANLCPPNSMRTANLC